jgi:hypothetical protein
MALGRLYMSIFATEGSPPSINDRGNPSTSSSYPSDASAGIAMVVRLLLELTLTRPATLANFGKLMVESVALEVRKRLPKPGPASGPDSG